MVTTNMIEFLQQTIGLYTLLSILAIALVTSAIHGSTGVAGGFLLAAAIGPIIGIKPIVPVISVALLISHTTRAILNANHFDRSAFLSITVASVPCIILAAIFYGSLSSNAIALILGSVILTSIPIRRWAKYKKVGANKTMLSGVGAIYGVLSGISIGPGMLLTPFMLGFGLSREAFVATLAAIALVTNIARVSVFGYSDLLDENYTFLGILIGLVTIPGNWLGRSFLRKMSNEYHYGLVDALTVFGAANLLWLGFR